MLDAMSMLVNSPLTQTDSKMKLDTDGDGKASYEEYRASKEKAQERQFKKNGHE